MSTQTEATIEPDTSYCCAVDRWGNPYPRGDVRYVSTFDETVEDVNAVTVEKLRGIQEQTNATMVFGHDGQQIHELRTAPEGSYT